MSAYDADMPTGRAVDLPDGSVVANSSLACVKQEGFLGDWRCTDARERSNEEIDLFIGSGGADVLRFGTDGR